MFVVQNLSFSGRLADALVEFILAVNLLNFFVELPSAEASLDINQDRNKLLAFINPDRFLVGVRLVGLAPFSGQNSAQN
jgi:hypothetical protein